MRTRRWQAGAAVALLLVIGAGCGDDDDSGGDDTEGTDEVGGSDAGSTDDTAADDSGGGDADVTMSNFAFNPDELTVASGDTVTVANEDGTSHTFTSEDGGFDLQLSGSESGEVTIDAEAGSYDFLCTIHPSMTGTITVE